MFCKITIVSITYISSPYLSYNQILKNRRQSVKIILSRKGFDSKYGGIPNLIMPNGDLVFLPIPELNSGMSYSNLIYGNSTYEKILKDLRYNYQDTSTHQVVWDCHLDPDIDHNKLNIKPSKAIFGQCDQAAGHLINHNVTKGDVFLFFGTFRNVEIKLDGAYHYVKKDKEKHIVFGYLEVDEVINKKEDILRDYHWHPHSKPFYINKTNNTLFTSCKHLFDTERPGHGVFSFSDDLILTEDNMSKSKWKPKHILTTTENMTYHKNANKGLFFQSARIGQEFIIDDLNNNKIKSWIIKQVCKKSDYETTREETKS